MRAHETAEVGTVVCHANTHTMRGGGGGGGVQGAAQHWNHVDAMREQ